MIDLLVVGCILTASYVPCEQAYNLYSPAGIVEKDNTKVYMGGWLHQGEKNDQIYGVFCSTKECGSPILVIPHGDYNHINDPTVVKKPAWIGFPEYYMMYMTCTKSQVGDFNYSDDICYSVSFNGHLWSDPQLLVRDRAYPSAVMIGNDVYLWTNSKFDGGKVVATNLGPYGTQFNAYNAVSTYIDAADINGRISNVDVKKFNDGSYHMLAEETHADNSSSITEFMSPDASHWTKINSNVVPLQPGYVYNGTPFYLTQDLIMYGATALHNSEGFNIRVLER